MARVHGVQTAGGWAFGEWLEQIRMARGLTLDDISRETKIPRRNLEALEHGDLGMIPTFYERAEVRAIARAVGVDERVAIGRLDEAVTPPPESREERTERATLSWWKLSDALVSVALGVGVLLAAAVVGRTAVSWMTSAQRPANPAAVAISRQEPEAVLTSEQAPAVEAPAAPQPVALEIPAATAPPEPLAEAEIVVTTVPSGATVTVNGISWGVTPVTIRHLPPGVKRIRATKEGFAASEAVVTLDHGQRQTLSLPLTGAN